MLRSVLASLMCSAVAIGLGSVIVPTGSAATGRTVAILQDPDGDSHRDGRVGPSIRNNAEILDVSFTVRPASRTTRVVINLRDVDEPNDVQITEVQLTGKARGSLTFRSLYYQRADSDYSEVASPGREPRVINCGMRATMSTKTNAVVFVVPFRCWPTRTLERITAAVYSQHVSGTPDGTVSDRLAAPPRRLVVVR